MKRIPAWFLLMAVIAWAAMGLTACNSARIGETVLSKPDEYSHTYEAKLKYILPAIAGVFKERGLGKDVRIDWGRQTVESDYVNKDDIRTRGVARVKKVNLRENEVFLSVITERKTGGGWEHRRFVEKEEYEKIFSKIELKIYQEMYKEQ